MLRTTRHTSNRFVATILCGLLLLSSHPLRTEEDQRGSGGLELQLITDRDEYLPCEPVLVKPILRNPTNISIPGPIPEPSFDVSALKLEIVMLDEDPVTSQAWDDPFLHTTAKPMYELSAHGEIHGKWNSLLVYYGRYKEAGDFVFAKPGEYEIIATYKSEKYKVYAKKRIQIVAPTSDMEREILAVLQHADKSLKKFYVARFASDRSFEKSDYRQQAREKIETLLERCPLSVYSAYLLFALGWDEYIKHRNWEIARARQETRYDPEAHKKAIARAEELWMRAKEVATLYGRDNLAAKCLAWLARLYRATGRLEEAINTLYQLRDHYPTSPDWEENGPGWLRSLEEERDRKK